MQQATSDSRQVTDLLFDMLQVNLALRAAGAPYVNRQEWSKLGPGDRKPDLRVSINALPHNVVSVLAAASGSITKHPLDWGKIRERVGAPVFDPLYYFQKVTVARAICSGGRLMLCDEMGLGKTKQAIACICALSCLAKQASSSSSGHRLKAKSLPCLVVCPKGLKVNMCNELVSTLLEHPQNLLGLDWDEIGHTPQKRAQWLKDKAGELHKQPAVLKRIAILNSGPEIKKWGERKDMSGALYEDKRAKAKGKAKAKTMGKGKASTAAAADLQEQDKEEEEDGCRFAITSYQLVEKFKQAMAGRGWFPETVVIDEAHSVKNWNTKQSLALLPLVKQVRYRFMLSGTPMQNASEFFSIISAVRPDLFPSYLEYVKRYCVAVPTTFRGPNGRPMTVTKYIGCVRRDELHAILSGTIMVRRTKKQVLKQMPELIRRCVYLPIALDSKRRTNKSKKTMSKTAAKTKVSSAGAGAVGGGRKGESKQGNKTEKPSFLQEMHNTIKTKLPVVLEEFRNSVLVPRADVPVSARKKLVLFVHHRKLGVALCKLLAEFKVPHVTVHGQGAWVWGPVARQTLRDTLLLSNKSRNAKSGAKTTAGGDREDPDGDHDMVDDDPDRSDSDNENAHQEMSSSSSGSDQSDSDDERGESHLAGAAKAKKRKLKQKKQLQLSPAYEPLKRDQAVHLFQTGSNADCEIAVLGLMAMRSGHTLTAANEAYMFELHPNPEVDLQAEARVHRIGQKELVTVTYYLQLETTDPKIYEIVRNKVQATSHVLDGKQSDFSFV